MVVFHRVGAGLEIAIKPDLAQVRALVEGRARGEVGAGHHFMLVVTVHSNPGARGRRSMASWPMASRRERAAETRVRPGRRSPSYNCGTITSRCLGQWVRPHEPRPI